MNVQQKEKPAKRKDLQGIRALAIIVVLGLHFFQDYCPNGFLGVDQFFVLSGFLMCMLLKKAENQSFPRLILEFYTRRFKRLLPLYFLVILVSMISLYLFFPDTAIETNQESAIRALTFTSNRPKTDRERYLQSLSLSENIFIHTWSLSVEIQFYLLVPFIFLLATKVPDKFQYGYYALLAIASAVFSYLSSHTISFNCVFARVWQFLIGMIVYLGAQKLHSYFSNGELPTKWSIASRTASYILLVGMMVIVGFPIMILLTYSIPTVTIGTGLLMLVSEGNWILSNKVLVYIGDISYSLYLIHWPICAYCKLTANGNIYYLLLAVCSSIVLAILTFETYEKWYLKLSTPRVAIIVVLLFLCSIIMVYKNDISDQVRYVFMEVPISDRVTADMTIDDAEAMNYRWNINDHKNLFVPSCDYEAPDTSYGWCRHKGLSEDGKYKLMIFGNSFTANHAKMFYEECGHKASSILQGAAYACEPLYANHANCLGNFSDFARRIEEEKPDIAFHITRFIEIGAALSGDVTMDPIYQTMKKQMLKFIANIKYKLLIVHAIPTVETSVQIAKLMKGGMDRVKIEKFFLDPTGYKNARKRYEQLVKDCGAKCELIDYLPEFYNNATRTFRYFDDRGFSYWTTSRHFSPHGLEKLRHVWTELCGKL